MAKLRTLLNWLRSLFGLQPLASAEPGFGPLADPASDAVWEEPFRHSPGQPVSGLESVPGAVARTGSQALPSSDEELRGQGSDEIRLTDPSGEQASIRRPIGPLDSSVVAAPSESAAPLPAEAMAVVPAQGDLPGDATVLDVDFSDNMTTEPLLRSGWGGYEGTGRCAEGPLAIIEVPAKIAGSAGYALRIDCDAFLHPPQVLQQRIHVTLNGSVQTDTLDLERSGGATFDYAIGSLADADQVEIRLGLPDCFRPIDVGQNEDSRYLSLWVKRILLVRASL